MEEFKLDLASQKVSQLGYVYKDIRKQAEIMESLYNVPKFAILEGEPQTIMYRGKESVMKTSLAISTYFNTQIELIQWHEGECLYKEFLDKGREGLQHISLFVQDLDKYVEGFKKMGIEVIQSGAIGRQHWAYFDTEKTFGMIIEVQATVSRKRKRPPKT